MPQALARFAVTSPRRIGAIAFFRAAIAAWRQRRALERLDASARHDLGLSQADVTRESNRPAWDVPQSWRV